MTESASVSVISQRSDLAEPVAPPAVEDPVPEALACNKSDRDLHGKSNIEYHAQRPLVFAICRDESSNIVARHPEVIWFPVVRCSNSEMRVLKGGLEMIDLDFSEQERVETLHLLTPSLRVEQAFCCSYAAQ